MNNKPNDNKSLEEMMKTASEEMNDTVPEEETRENHSPKKVIYGTLGVIVTLSIVLAIGAMIMRNNDDFKDETKQPDWIGEEVKKKEKEEVHLEWEYEYPTKVPKWTKQPYSKVGIIDDENNYNELVKYADKYQDIISATSWMPSKIKGDWEGAPPVFTSNTWESVLEDGTRNPLYSYTVREDYLSAYASYIQRLINPVFGDWVFYQRSVPVKPYIADNHYEVLKDMFTPEWWSANIKESQDYSAIPILADWRGDNFGGIEFAELETGRYGTWYGEINETDNEFVTAEMLGTDNNGAEIIKTSTPIKYTAFGKDKEIIEKLGTLELTLKSNDDEIEIYNRVVISDAKLILK